MRAIMLASSVGVLQLLSFSAPLSAFAAPVSSAPNCVDPVPMWSLSQRVAQVIMVSGNFSNLGASSGAASAGVGGFVFFGQPAAGSGPSIAGGIAALRSAAANAGQVVPLMSTDEEGGDVQRLSNVVGSLPSARWMAANWSTQQVQSALAATSSSMHSLGITMDLAPVLDVSPPTNTIADEATRSFSNDPNVVTSYGIAFAHGVQAGGVIPVVKHFPGLGHASANTDVATAYDPPLATLQTDDLIPFAQAVNAGLPAVMVGHPIVPNLTGGMPASLSPATYQYLRNTLHFNGVAITDDLAARAVSNAGYSQASGAAGAIEAGADMAMIDAGSLSATVSAIEAAVSSGALPQDVLNAAVSRILAIKGERVCLTGGSDAVGMATPATHAYFAEGYTGPGFVEYLTVENPGVAQLLTVQYLLQGGTTINKQYSLAAQSRTTILVNNDVGPNQNVSAFLSAPLPFVAERPMYFNYLNIATGGHDVMGATALGTTFYFGEGYTGPGFYEYLTLMNPDPVNAANVNITYYFNGAGRKTVPWVVPPHSRTTTYVNDPSQAGPNREVSTVVTSTNGVPFLAERPMYFAFGPGWTGGSVVVGAAAPSQHLNLAEGFVGSNFDEYLTVLNANPVAAHLTITYEVQGSANKTIGMTVPADSRGTHLVNTDFSQATSLALHVDSDQPVVIERPMYFDYGSNWNGGHDAIAVDDSALATTFNFAEGNVAPNFDEYLSLLNDTGQAANVTVTYFLTGGGTKQVTMQVPANSRATRRVNDDFPGQSVSQSAQVTSTNGVPILAERPMYFAY